MNPTIYKQLDSRWSSKPYPTYASSFGGNGCGCCACVHVAMEQQSKADWNPETLRPWMVNQGYAVAGKGTLWQGIYDTLKYIGHDSVVWIHEADPMSKAWAELDKGNRIGVLLVDNGSTPDGTYWTSSGHFVAFVEYKVENGQHWFYIKDSGGRNHDGWFCYEKSIKHALPQLFIVERIGKEPTPPTPTPTGKIPVNGIGDSTTVKALQKCLGLSQDGVISNQYATQQKYRPALTAVTNGRGGSRTVSALQTWCNLSPDGYWGGNTSKGLQKKLRDYGYLAPNEPLDNICGKKTMSALQECINNGLKPKGQPTPPTPTPTTYTTVIDVSAFQDAINWASVKTSGVVGAMVRCGYRGYETGKLNEDSMFLNHIKGAYNAGLKVGVYFFTEALNWAEGKEEAEYTMKLIEKSGVNLYYPIAVDTEAQSASTERAKHLSVAQRTDAIKGFCETIKERGGQPMIYASTNWFENKLDMSKLPYDCWCAQYYKECQYKGKVVMWQYTSEGSVNGVKGVVDMNKCYITSPAPQPQPKPTPSGGYTGAFPTEAEIKEAQVNAMCQACKDQTAWSYSSVYEFENNPTIPKSKTKSTCVTYVSCVLQRTGVYDSGDCLWCDGRGYGNGKVRGANGQMSVTYYNNKKSLKDLDLQTCDILIYDDNQSGEMGNGGHEEIFNGVRNANYSYFYSGGTGSYHNTTNNNRENNSRKVLAVVRIKWRTFIKKGDRGNAVLEWQDFLNWWSDGQFYEECGKGDGVFGSNTDKWTKAFQTAVFGASEADGTVGMKTIAKAKEIRK